MKNKTVNSIKLLTKEEMNKLTTERLLAYLRANLTFHRGLGYDADEFDFEIHEKRCLEIESTKKIALEILATRENIK